MRRFMFALPAILLLTAAAKETAPDYGPDPTWERAVPLAEAAIKDNLIDPSSAQIEWPYNFSTGTLKGLLAKRRSGWITCGWVNAKNRMGGYTGKVWFLVIINTGVVTEIELGTPDGIDVASASCPSLVKQGFLKPAPAPVPGTTPPLTADAYAAAYAAAANAGAREAAARGGVGITYNVTPFGAMLVGVAPGSLAETAGLKPGEVIESVNGISIKGFDLPTIQKIMAGTAGNLVFGVVGVGPVTIKRAAK
jgi:hypothetical protein